MAFSDDQKTGKTEGRNEGRIDLAKAYLNEVRLARQRIRVAKDHLARLEDVGLPGVQYDSVRVQTSHTGDKMAELAVRIEEAELDLLDAVREQIEAETEATDLIRRLADPREARILYARYIQGKRYEELPDALGQEFQVCERQAFRILASATRNFAQLFAESEIGRAWREKMS